MHTACMTLLASFILVDTTIPMFYTVNPPAMAQSRINLLVMGKDLEGAYSVPAFGVFPRYLLDSLPCVFSRSLFLCEIFLIIMLDKAVDSHRGYAVIIPIR